MQKSHRIISARQYCTRVNAKLRPAPCYNRRPAGEQFGCEQFPRRTRKRHRPVASLRPACDSTRRLHELNRLTLSQRGTSLDDFNHSTRFSASCFSLGCGSRAATALGGVHLSAEEAPAVVRLGIIGCGGIMTHHVKGLVGRREAVSIAWLCDVDPAQIAKISAHVTRDFQAAPPKQTARYEDVIEDRNVDAVIIATPHHWHAPIALRAMQAGKDVYIEKPISHVFSEGPMIIAAAKKYGRIVQQGSQMRAVR